LGLTAALCGTGECLRWGRGGAAPAYIASGYDKVATVKKKERLTVQAPSRALCFQAFFGGYRRNGGPESGWIWMGRERQGSMTPQAAGEACEGGYRWRALCVAGS